MECKICGAPLPEKATTGRPLTYCGSACRRAAELEIKRVDKLLDGCEARLSARRLGETDFDELMMSKQAPGVVHKLLIDEVELFKARLRVLLAE